MALTPDDIVGYEFKQSLRGYAVDEVDDLLDRLADQIEQTDRELDEMRQRVRDAEARLASALETESTLKRTLITAQEAAERSLAEAREQADEIRDAAERQATDQLEHAEREAERVLSEARSEAERVTSEARSQARAEVHDAHQRRIAIEQRISSLRELERRHRSVVERHLREELSRLEQFAAEAGDVGEEDRGSATADTPHLTVRVRGDQDVAAHRDEPAVTPHESRAAEAPSGPGESGSDEQAAGGDDIAATAAAWSLGLGDDDETVPDEPAVPEPWRAAVDDEAGDADADEGADGDDEDATPLWPQVDIRPDADAPSSTRSDS